MSDWTKEAVEVLIEAYKKYDVLYNSKLPGYQNKHSRKDALDRVVIEVRSVRPQTTVDDVKKKFLSLRTHYGHEVQKVEKSRRSGADAGTVYTPTVWWFTLMGFVKDHIQPRKGESTVPSYLSCVNAAPVSVPETLLTVQVSFVKKILLVY